MSRILIVEDDKDLDNIRSDTRYKELKKKLLREKEESDKKDK